MKVVLFFIFFSLPAFAQNLHLTAGGGVNASSYGPSNAATVVGGGLNFKTDLGYYFDNNWAVEVSSQVKFNQQNNFFIWDTLMTAGLRYQFTDSLYYARGFYGRSPTVIYLDDAPEVTKQTNSSRIQFDGPVYGFGVGKLLRTDTGKIWFIESAVSYQRLEKQTGIRNDGNVPKEIFNSKIDNPIEVFSLYAVIGVRIF